MISAIQASNSPCSRSPDRHALAPSIPLFVGHPGCRRRRLYGQSPQPPSASGLTPYTFGNPSDDETEILAIINRTRANPPAEGQRLIAQTTSAFDPSGTLSNVTTKTVTLNHTVCSTGPEEYNVDEFYDAAGNVRYDNAEIDLVEPATAGSQPTPSPSPTPPPTTPQVTIAVEQDSEQFVLSRTGDTSGVLVVTYLTKGSAVAGQDYVPLPGTKTIKAGKITAKITVHALTGAQGTVKLRLVPTVNFYGAPSPAQAKMRL